MPARLPRPGRDEGTWGDILNDFLSEAHNADGSIKDIGVVADKYTLPSGGIPEADLDSDIQDKINNKLDASGGTVTGDLDMDGNKITGLSDGVDSTDVTTFGQLTSAINDVENDMASVGVEITDLPTALRTDSSWATAYTNDQNYVPIVQNGVAKKMPLELFTTMDPIAGTSITGTTHTWASGQHTLICTNTSPLTITLPAFASPSGLHAPVRVMRMGTGSVTLAAGSGVTLNKAASLPLTLRQQYSVGYFWIYFGNSGIAFYLAWGDLG